MQDLLDNLRDSDQCSLDNLKSLQIFHPRLLFISDVVCSSPFLNAPHQPGIAIQSQDLYQLAHYLQVSEFFFSSFPWSNITTSSLSHILSLTHTHIFEWLSNYHIRDCTVTVGCLYCMASLLHFSPYPTLLIFFIFDRFFKDKWSTSCQNFVRLCVLQFKAKVCISLCPEVITPFPLTHTQIFSRHLSPTKSYKQNWLLCQSVFTMAYI